MTTREASLFGELLRVHDMLRRDLAAVKEIAAAAAAGEPAVRVRDGLDALHARGPLLQLKANCLGYCQLVHAHHGGEDGMLFPAVRRAAPHLAGTVDRLEEDHRTVSDLLDKIEAAARDLGSDGDAARVRLVEALDSLTTHLHEHLAFEEQALAPVLRTWTHWPGH
ncbi:hemerythrin domain-containing protein [Phytohabitans sp. LJ34]|uniref:hemerythrin domain-containing protein n=1 Tax=Phytohabitans sp. LJ34 TaxID=3452217 RepID=UPI003F8AF909